MAARQREQPPTRLPLVSQRRPALLLVADQHAEQLAPWLDRYVPDWRAETGPFRLTDWASLAVPIPPGNAWWELLDLATKAGLSLDGNPSAAVCTVAPRRPAWRRGLAVVFGRHKPAWRR